MSEDPSISVLLVDDDPYIRETLSEHLEEAGFEPRQAEDGIDGVKKLRKGLPKVIISDLQMPRMAGIEFISVLRRRFPSIPVVVLTGSIPDPVPMEAKPDAWFEKGALNMHQLLETLQDLVRKTPDPANVPQIVTTPIRTGPSSTGYINLTCPDCLRPLRARYGVEIGAVAGTAVCNHCEALVPFLLEGLEAA
jgi:CheY-like chemotaxis protein